MTVADARLRAGCLSHGCEDAIIYGRCPRNVQPKDGQYFRPTSQLQYNFLVANEFPAASCSWSKSSARPAVAPTRSLTDTKLAKNRIENLFHIRDANDFADCAQCLIEVNSYVFHRQSFAQSRPRAIA